MTSIAVAKVFVVVIVIFFHRNASNLRYNRILPGWDGLSGLRDIHPDRNGSLISVPTWI